MFLFCSGTYPLVLWNKGGTSDVLQCLCVDCSLNPVLTLENLLCDSCSPPACKSSACKPYLLGNSARRAGFSGNVRQFLLLVVAGMGNCSKLRMRHITFLADGPSDGWAENCRIWQDVIKCVSVSSGYAFQKLRAAPYGAALFVIINAL